MKQPPQPFVNPQKTAASQQHTASKGLRSGFPAGAKIYSGVASLNTKKGGE